MDNNLSDMMHKRLDRIEDKLDDLIVSHQFFRGRVAGATLILSIISGGFVSYIFWLVQK